MAGKPSSTGYVRPMVRRTRLLAALEEAEGRTILLLAPAGYGKTTLARQWLENVPGAWVGVTIASGDIPVLARDLAAAVGEVGAIDMRRVETALQAGRTPTDQARAVARTILTQTPSPLDGWIVIDNYQFIAGNSAAEELISRLERSEKFRLLITSRERPSWATSRRRVHLDTFEVGASELALDEEEVAQLLPPDRRTAALRRQARGWPAVIALAAHARLADVALTVETLSEQLYNYLAEELFESLGSDFQRWLTSVAVLPPLPPAELSTFLGADGAAERVVATGLAYEADGRVEVHPLARTFLVAKLRERSDAREIGIAAFEVAIDVGQYDQAFDLIEAAGVGDRLERLIIRAYADLVETGRVGTLARFLRCGDREARVPQALHDLIGADRALNAGNLDRAQALGEATFRQLPNAHPLKPRGYLVAGRAAHLSHRLEQAFNYHAAARRHASTAADINDATWGMCIAMLYREDDRVERAIDQMESLETVRPTDRVRLDFARTQYSILGGHPPVGVDPDVEQIVAGITDPWVRTGWSYTRGHILVLQGRYEDAIQILKTAEAELDEFGLEFGLRHVEWSLSAAELGLRHFSSCEKRLRKVERYLSRQWDLHTELNVRVLRARLSLAQQRLSEAVETTAEEFTEIPGRAMYAEYIATRALALAAAGHESAAIAAASQAQLMTRSSDTRVLCAAANAVARANHPESAQNAADELIATASRLGIWDGVVCAVRALPSILPSLAANPGYRSELRTALLRSRDLRLAKSVGLVTRTTGTRGTLTSRECEVMEEVTLGRTNADIATSLFITVGTVKRHLDHAYNKLGARNRAEAIARYAEIEKDESPDSAF
jgi:ATP/maltotriose-dependent transcriptional regulator MalT